MMLKTKLVPMATVLSLSVSGLVHAGTVTDKHGNVGYDTAAECDAAVQSGSANFYKSYTTKHALRRKGEASVKPALLKDVAPEYKLGACDLGSAHKFGRDGVAPVLQGKYVPFSPEAPVNVYYDRKGRPVRVTMKQCDNNFSAAMPRPVPVPAPAPVAAPQAEPVAPTPIAPAPAAAVQAAPAPAPVVAPAPAPVSEISPYVFGTIGAFRDGLTGDRGSPVRGHDADFAGQIGAGLQLNPLFGGEVFFQDGKKNGYGSSEAVRTGAKIFGARATLGDDLTPEARIFGKLGLASVRHDGYVPQGGGSASQTRVDGGLGATYALTKNLDLRVDYDHYFKRGSAFTGADDLGAGLQFNF